MVSWSDVTQWNAGKLEGHVDDVVVTRRDVASGGLDLAGLDVGVAWSGQGATAAASAVQTLVGDINFLLSNLDAYRDAISGAKDGIGVVQTNVTEVQDFANHYGFVIGSDGTVSDPTPIHIPFLYEPLPNDPNNLYVQRSEREAALKECQEYASAALEQAGQLDTELSAALAAIIDLDVAVLDKIGNLDFDRADLPLGASTEEVAAWWDSLTPEEQASVLDEFYGEVGGLDGVDGWARDLANRKNLELMLAEDPTNPSLAAIASSLNYVYDGERWHSPTLYVSSPSGDETASLLAGSYGWDIQPSLGTNDVNQLLLVDQIDGVDGKPVWVAAVSSGDIDTADNVSTLIPGMTTTVEGGFANELGNITRIRQHADVQGEYETNAVVAWLGYDAPPGLGSAASLERAQVGGDDLSQFLEGVYDSRATQGATQPRLTTIGHSYGSTTAASAVSDIRPGVVDGVMLYGSPGMDALNGADLNVTPGADGSADLRVMMYPNDAINWLHTGLVPDYRDGLLGPRPDRDPDFVNVTAGKSGEWWPLAAHTVYDDNTDTLVEIGKFVAGE